MEKESSSMICLSISPPWKYKMWSIIIWRNLAETLCTALIYFSAHVAFNHVRSLCQAPNGLLLSSALQACCRKLGFKSSILDKSTRSNAPCICNAPTGTCIVEIMTQRHSRLLRQGLMSDRMWWLCAVFCIRALYEVPSRCTDLLPGGDKLDSSHLQ